MKNSLLLAIILIIAAAAFRIFNIEQSVWLNFSILGAVSLFSGAVIRNRSVAYIVPLTTYLLTDLYIHYFTNSVGFYGVSQVFTYVAMALVVLLGSNMKTIKPLKVLGYSLSASMIFWIVSNFGVWFGNLFTQFEPGLTLGFTYLRAVPFYNQMATELFTGTFVGDLVSSVVLFGTYLLLSGSRASTVAA